MNEAVHDLVFLYVQGETSPEETAQLQRAIDADPRIMAALLEAATLDYELYARSRATASATTSSQRTPAAVATFAAAPHRKRTWVYALAASFALAALLGVAFFSHTAAPATTAKLSSVDGGVAITRGPQRLAPVPGMPLQPQDSISVPAGAAATLTYEDGTHLDFAAHAQFIFEPASPTQSTNPSGSSGKCIYLQNGTVSADVAKQPLGEPLQLKTRHAVATVLGTQLRLHAEDDFTRLTVLSGKVTLADAETGHSITVAGGEFAVADRAGDPVAQTAVRIELEAESGELVGPMEVERDAGASAGTYVASPRGAPQAMIASETLGVRTQHAETGALRLKFNLVQAGDYTVWLRAYAADGNHDSVYVSVDGADERAADFFGHKYGAWRWTPVVRRVEAAKDAEPAVVTRNFHLAAGAHVLTLSVREADYRIDQVLVTNDPDLDLKLQN